ncbi:hypothetical protein TNCV_2203811 [Trichonephila clavipes]|nr:hypothetical protein TNCV_2203811 [Trichonephila clavipes]
MHQGHDNKLIKCYSRVFVTSSSKALQPVAGQGFLAKSSSPTGPVRHNIPPSDYSNYPQVIFNIIQPPNWWSSLLSFSIDS